MKLSSLLVIPAALLLVPTQGGAQQIANVYKQRCAMCHGADGSGNTAMGRSMKLKDLRAAEVQAMTDEQLYEIIAKGKGKMPGYEKSLGADTVRQLVAYIREMGKNK
ncbi:MAG: c-type cytochrome [Rhodospirillales bacterium]